MASDYSPPRLVKPTPGGSAGDGSMDGALTVQANTSSGNAVLIGSAKDVLVGTDANYTDSLAINQGQFYPGGTRVYGGGGGYIGVGSSGLTVVGGKVGYFNGINTGGYGLSPIYSAGYRVALGTTSTAVASYGPGADGSFRVVWRLACIAATTPTLTVAWTDPDAGAQSKNVSPGAMAAGTVASGVLPIAATTAGITVTGSALAANDATATVEIVQSQ